MSLLTKHLRSSIMKLSKRAQQTQAKLQATANLPGGPVFRNAQNFPDRVALRDHISSYTYANIYLSANELSKEITQLVHGRTGERVLFMCPNDANYVITLWAIWMSGQIENISVGVVLSHKNLQFQISTLVDAWKWSSNDVILHTLPLHHVHGIVNALLCPLHIGAKTIMLKKFNANNVWSYLLGINAKPEDRKISVYMAVPTIYNKLIEEYDRVFKADNKMVEYIRNTMKNKIRLMVSGSAGLPVPICERWKEISGHRLLERYGMTETGMTLSHVYESDREPGNVGIPLPGVSIRLVEDDENSEELKTILECSNVDGELKFTEKVYKSENHKGELLVKGDGIFREYYNRPEATRKEFTNDGWFKTGDICEYLAEKKVFKIVGRKSVDIIKSGGYKLSALEIEAKLLLHPDIQECAVVGLEDETWGQQVAAFVVPKQDKEITLENLRKWSEDKMPKYWVPKVLKIMNSIPKNAMGKVNKKELAKSFS
nr:acyl-CoA synthetase family member 3, mitochondrial [Leptinotarsa decemlineata]